MKKIVLSLLLVLTCLAQASAYTFEVDGIYYNKSGTNATVTFRDNSYNSYSGEVIIPDTVTVDGVAYPVTAIGDNAFYNCSELTAVNIPAGVTSIGGSAFNGCTSLEGVTIPAGVTSLPNYRYAFGNCTGLKWLEWNAVNCTEHGAMPTSNLERITIGDGVTVLPGDFARDSKITEIAIPSSVSTIGGSAFNGCTLLDGVVLPDGLTSIGSYAFNGCTSLKGIVIPAAITVIPEYAFNGCTSLASAVIPAGVTSIGGSAFNGCTSLEGVTIPAGVTSLPNYRYAFGNCTGLKWLEWNAVNCTEHGAMPTSNLERITIGDGVTVLPDNFLYQSKITEIDIPESVTTIRYRALRECAGLTEVTLPSGLTTLGSESLSHCTSLRSIVIPDGVTAISDYTFFGCTSLENAVLPANCTSIGSYAFYGCTSLSSANIPAGVKSIGYQAFWNCTSLQGVAIPAGVTSLNSSQFTGCTGLTWLEWNAVNCPNNGGMPTANIERVSIGDGVTVLPDNFLYQSKITEIDIPESVTTIRYRALRECAGLTEVTLPSGLTTLGSESLSHCTSLRSIVIPDGVTAISDYTFFGCTSLENAVLPANCTSIGSYAFYGCTSLSSANIPAGVKSIGYQAFWNCTSLQGVAIPAGVTSLNSSQFTGCTGLTWLEWNAVNCPNNGGMPTANLERITIGEGVTVLPGSFAENSKITEISIPSSVKTIGSYAFNWCTELQEVYIPDSVTVINEHTFGACLGLVQAHLPAALTEIKRSGFERCPSLKEIVLPAGVTKLGDYVFYNCDSLTSLTVRAIEPPTVTSSTTLSTLYNIAKLRVPRGVIEDYQAANYWKNFLTIVGDEYDFEVDGIYYVQTGETTASVTYRDTDYNTYSGNVTIPKEVTHEGVTYRVTGISFEAFKDCPELTRVSMSKRIQSIGYNAFENCTALTRVTIPDKVTAIGAGAFKGCTSLTEATLGSSVATVGAQAFDGCDALTMVMSRSVTPPTLAGRDCFNCYETATLRVPIAAVEDYRTANYWREFMEIVGVEINAGPGDVDGDGNIGIADVTALIDYLLYGGGSGFYEENGDFDEDGVVGIADATALIDYLLNGGDDD